MKWDDYFLPFPKKVKFWKALKWFLIANHKPYAKDKRLKYCTQCGWPIVYLDDLYDIPEEAYSPDVVAMCSLCGEEYVNWYGFCGNKIRAVIPKI